MRLVRARDNAFHSTSSKWKKEQKRLGTKRQRSNGKIIIKEAV